MQVPPSAPGAPAAPPQVPAGFGPILRSSPFLDHIGPLYSRGQAPEIVVGFHVRPHHANNREGLHGGVLPAIADILAGYNMALSHDPPRRLVTTSIGLDYLGSAKIGDWIEARCDFRHEGGRLCVAHCEFRCGDRVVARAIARFIPAG
jgi:acyl-coenzyme A thioesterase 13